MNKKSTAAKSIININDTLSLKKEKKKHQQYLYYILNKINKKYAVTTKTTNQYCIRNYFNLVKEKKYLVPIDFGVLF